MADKRIQDLTPAESVQTSDRFVLEQSGQAKSLTGQVLINDLAAALDGHGGISNISYTAPTSPSLDGLLTITMADETEYYLDVTNGRGISNITWTTSGTAGDGMTHTGTIDYNDGTSSTVTFQDGLKGDQGVQTYVWFKWASVYPTADSDMQNNVGAYIGIYSGISSSAPTHYTDYIWYQYKGDTGDTGASIQSIAKTSTTGLVDTYTVTLTNGNTSTFTVTNAKSIVSVVMTSGSHAAGTTDVYTITFNDGDTSTFSVYNGVNGLGAVSTVSGIQADGDGDVPQVISGNGAPTTATVGQKNQLYYDLTNSILYYCYGENEGTYTWLGAGVTVDSSLSNSSTNPVQNRVITGRVGTGVLPNGTSDLTSAVNYLESVIPTAATATPLADTTGGAVGTGTNWAKNDHQHPLNVATSGTPPMDGTASRGSAATYARSDHVHPTDTTRVDKSGDTMTGNLIVSTNNSPTVSIKNTDMDVTAASLSSNEFASFAFTDKNNQTFGYLQGYEETNGNDGFAIRVYKTVSGSSVANYLNLVVSKTGERSIAIPDSAPWLTALGLGSVTTESIASNIATAASGVTITEASYAQWGKLATIKIKFKKSAAISSYTTICTLVSGKRPAVESGASVQLQTGNYAVVNTSGNIGVSGSFSANTEYSLNATYILA